MVNVRLSEEVDSNGRTIILKCATERIFPCMNYRIATEHHAKNNEIVIRFIEVDKSAICLTAIGPASAWLNFDNLSNGDHFIEFYSGDEHVVGMLRVSAGSLRILLPVQDRVRLLNTELNRIPDNTIYGKVHYRAPSSIPIVQKFIDSLYALGAAPGSYLPGDYEHFRIDSAGQIEQTGDAGYGYTRHFVFHYSGNSAPMRKIVEDFGIATADSVLISMHNSRGERFYSWLH